jgi:hypothetical protein
MNKDLATNMFWKLSLQNLILQTILNYISKTFLEFTSKHARALQRGKTNI